MRAGTRVALYGLLLAALFTASYLIAGAVVPEAWATGWAGPGHRARTAARDHPRKSATPLEREDPHHDHSPGPVPAGRRYRTRDRRDDLRLVRQPGRTEAQQARRGHRGGQLRHREGTGLRPRGLRPARADHGGRADRVHRGTARTRADGP